MAANATTTTAPNVRGTIAIAPERLLLEDGAAEPLPAPPGAGVVDAVADAVNEIGIVGTLPSVGIYVVPVAPGILAAGRGL